MTKDSIDRFFRSESSPEEAQAVVQYFEQHPGEVELYLSDKEWEDFQADSKLGLDKSAALWKQISSRTIHKSAGRIVLLKSLVAAASVIAIVLAGWWWFSQPRTTAAGKEHVISQLIQNTSRQVMELKLPDSSGIQLMPASSISYKEPFQNNRREITLKGEAFFSVTKDSLQPFIVYSDAISTTVLGTQFLVTSFDKENTIKVQLFSGHVVVKAVDSLHTQLKQEIHLLPGDILLYDKTKLTASVSSGTEDKPKAETTGPSRGTAASLSGNNWYMFNNQPLADVLDQLQILYNERIAYSKEDVKGLSYIGKIDRRDTLQTILNEIGRLNNLRVSKEQSGFLVRKK